MRANRAIAVRFRLVALALLAIGAISAAHAAESSARSDYAAAARLTADSARGRELFGVCAACHGVDGNGQRDGSIPAIAGQHRSVLLRQLIDFRHQRRWDIRMEHFAASKRFPDLADLVDLAAYASSLPVRPGRAQTGNGTELRSGVSAYLTNCSRCHGTSGQGDSAKDVPRLAGQHYEYLVRQMHDTMENRRPNMAPTHIDLLRRVLDRDVIDGIADYLSRLCADRACSGPPQNQ
ncbi:MAG: c-type cytochrome [Steroidobacteraceae bacterium]